MPPLTVLDLDDLILGILMVVGGAWSYIAHERERRSTATPGLPGGFRATVFLLIGTRALVHALVPDALIVSSVSTLAAVAIMATVPIAYRGRLIASQPAWALSGGPSALDLGLFRVVGWYAILVTAGGGSAMFWAAEDSWRGLMAGVVGVGAAVLVFRAMRELPPADAAGGPGIGPTPVSHGEAA